MRAPSANRRDVDPTRRGARGAAQETRRGESGSAAVSLAISFVLPAPRVAALLVPALHVAALLGVLAPASALTQPADEFTAGPLSQEIVERGATWRFFRGRAEPSAGTLDWTLPGFDDGAWETGAAGFGYEDDDDATVLSDMEDRYTTVYIRKTFELPDPDAIAALDLTIDYDDGFVAFLNGREIARANAGSAGGLPAFDDTATRSHEAGTPAVFRVGGAAALLAPGSNVLAVVGLNAEIGSSDFSLHPSLGGISVLGEGCSGDLYVGGSEVLIGGAAPASAAEVRVNGMLADLDSASGEWSFAVAVGEGVLDLVAEARDAAGAPIATRTLRAIRVRAMGGEVAEGATWTPAGPPLLVVAPVWVPSGRVLTIEAGCEILIQPGVGFIVQGAVRALGTVEAPVRFTRVPCQANWGHFEFEGARGGSAFAFAEWSYSKGDPGCLTLTDSDLELDGCAIRDIDGEGVHATGSRTRIRNCLSERTAEAFSLDRGDTVVEFCTVRDTVGKSDLIDANGSIDPPARIAFNHIYNTTDDGIDVDAGSIVAEGNIIHDCGDQAISLVGAGESRIVRNVCFRNGHGLSVKDSHVSIAEFNTFALNELTGVRAIEKTPGRGGGKVSLLNCIVWGNASQLVVESTGTIDVAYCDVEGTVAPGPGNISLDPLFVDPASGDFHLTEGSPCIGAASDGGDMGALPFSPASTAPTIESIDPAEGPAGGGTAVVIRGAKFLGSVEARLGGKPLASIVLAGPEEIRGVTPPGPAGPADLTVWAEGGQATLAGAFQYFETIARGDADADGRRTVSDAIAVLAFLFQEGAAPRCLEVADSNGDGDVDVADPVFLLLFLFVGGAAPEPAEVRCE